MAVAFACALAVLAGYTLFALCGNLLYWYETLNSPEGRIPSPRPGFSSCLALFCNSFGSYLLCALIFVLAPFSRKKIRRPDAAAKGAPPLILIHGLYNSAAVWLYLGRRFRAEGFPVSTFSYHSFFRASPAKILAGLEAHVRAVEAAFPGQKPVFVCHSLGGLLARHWLLANSTRAGGVLTLGAPHRGSKVAALAPGPLAKILRPGSAFLAALRDAPEAPAVPCVSLASPTDEAVLPAASLVPPAGWGLRVTRPTGHFRMLFCPRVAAMVMEELENIRAEG